MTKWGASCIVCCKRRLSCLFSHPGLLPLCFEVGGLRFDPHGSHRHSYLPSLLQRILNPPVLLSSCAREETRGCQGWPVVGRESHPRRGLGASRELGHYEEPWEGRERCRDGRCVEHGAVEGVHRRAPFGSPLEW